MKRKKIAKLLFGFYLLVALGAGVLYLVGYFPGQTSEEAEEPDETEYGIQVIEKTASSLDEDVRNVQRDKSAENVENQKNDSTVVNDDLKTGANSDNGENNAASAVQEGGDNETSGPSESGDTETSGTSEGGDTETSGTSEGGDTETSGASESGDTETSGTSEGGDTETSGTSESGDAVVADLPEEGNDGAATDNSDGTEVRNIQFVANVKKNLNVRQEPSIESDVVGVLHGGDHGYVVETGSEFTHIICGDIEGYVSNDYILTGEAAEDRINSNDDAVAAGSGSVAAGSGSVAAGSESVKITSDCYARSGPGTSYAVLGTARRGSVYQKASSDEATKSWIAIIFDNNSIAYVSSIYAKTTE